MRHNTPHLRLIPDTRARAVLRSARQLPRAVPTTTKFSTSGTGLVTRGATPPWDGVEELAVLSRWLVTPPYAKPVVTTRGFRVCDSEG